MAGNNNVEEEPYRFYPAFANNQDKGYIFEYLQPQNGGIAFIDLIIKNQYRNLLMNSFPNMHGEFSESGDKLFLFSEGFPNVQGIPNNEEGEIIVPMAVLQFVEFNGEKGIAVMIFSDEENLAQNLRAKILDFYGSVPPLQQEGGRKGRKGKGRSTRKSRKAGKGKGKGRTRSNRK